MRSRGKGILGVSVCRPAIAQTYTFADVRSGVAGGPDVVVVPGVGGPDGPDEAASAHEIEASLREWAASLHHPIDALHGFDEALGLDGALEYLSAHYGRATAVSAAR